MQVVVTAGSLRAGLEAPLLVGLESFVRAPRRGEPSSAAPCPSCRGATVVSGRRGSLRWTSTCPRCGGRGAVVGVHLARLVADEGSPDIAALLAWAREHRLRADVQMLLRDERGPGSLACGTCASPPADGGAMNQTWAGYVTQTPACLASPALAAAE